MKALQIYSSLALLFVAGCATASSTEALTFAEVEKLDVRSFRERLLASHAPARMIRSRYTVLDLVAESGWWKSCVDAQFEAGGFWA